MHNPENMDIEQLFRSSYRALCLYAIHYVGDTDTAEEVVQECFVRFAEETSAGVHFVSPSSHLYGMVRDACLDRLQHDGRQADTVAERAVGMSSDGFADDGELQFAPDYDKSYCFDTERAWRRLCDMHVVQRHVHRRFAVSMARAAALGLVAAACIAGYCICLLSPGDVPHGNIGMPVACVDSVQCEADTTDVFYFNDSPVSEVLGAISQQYGVELSASDTTKRISGEVEASSVDEAIAKLEMMMGIKITKKQ